MDMIIHYDIWSDQVDHNIFSFHLSTSRAPADCGQEVHAHMARPPVA